jgi:CPA2 family monovalent cation:H+ antiporter-2
VIHLPELISDLGFILITAAVVTLLFRRLNQPVVLGYLIAGFLVGPNIPFLPTVSDPESVKVWAEIGVIFLLFSLGLEFSFKKLAHVGKSASITALFEVVSMVGIGFLTGLALGWSNMDSLFLGGILSISSTTIIVRAFDELGLKGKRFVSLVFGVLIVEDLVAILLLVLLSTVAVTQTLSGVELLSSTLKLGFFLLLWFLIGIYLLPPFLTMVRSLLTDETALVVALGLCLLMVIIATKVGFSPALGAFVMGSLLAETRDAKRIEHLVAPVRDLFAAVFFVSVGMMIDVGVLLQYGPEILLISTVTIVGKFLSSAVGALVSGRNLKDSVAAGLSLAQIGEFSFIIATLGLTLKVTSDFLYPIAVAVSAITTFSTPYLIRSADPLFKWLRVRLPAPVMNMIDRYQVAANQEGKQTFIKLIWLAHGPRTLFSAIITIAIGLSLNKFLQPIALQQFGESTWLTVGFAISALLLAAPFLWAVVLGRASLELSNEETARLEKLRPGLMIARTLGAFLLITFLINLFVPSGAVIGLVASLAMIGLALVAKFAAPVYAHFENRFVENLADKDRVDIGSLRPLLTPWDASLSELVVSPNSEFVGRTLLDSKVKERFGVMVSLIERGSKRILAPNRNHVLMPFDRLFVIGNDEQLQDARRVIEEAPLKSLDTPPPVAFGLSSLLIKQPSRYIGRSLRDCGLREDADGIVVGIERSGTRILNPDSNEVLQEDDLIWVVGDLKKTDRLRS